MSGNKNLRVTNVGFLETLYPKKCYRLCHKNVNTVGYPTKAILKG